MRKHKQIYTNDNDIDQNNYQFDLYRKIGNQLVVQFEDSTWSKLENVLWFAIYNDEPFVDTKLKLKLQLNMEFGNE